MSNLILAVGFTLALYVATRVDPTGGMRQPLFALLQTGVVLNVMLAVFNLLPLPPLDGSHIVSWGLPRNLGERYDAIMEPYGQWILLGLFVSGALSAVVSPIVVAIVGVLARIIG